MKSNVRKKERLLALIMVVTMVITNMSSSIAFALDGEVLSRDQAVIQSGSINWGFRLEDENGKKYDATCMEPSNQTIPSVGGKVNMAFLTRSGVLAWIAYLGKDRYTSDEKKQQYIISRAAARYTGDVAKNNYILYDSVNNLYDDALAKSKAGESVPQSFAVYTAKPTNGAQKMLAWRSVSDSTITLKKTSETPTSKSLAGAKYGVYTTKTAANENNTDKRVGILTTKEDGSTNTLRVYFTGSKTYYVKEYKAPDGFGLDDAVYSKTLKEGGSWTIKSEDPLEEGGLKVVKTTNVNPIPEGYSLAGAKYGVYTTKTAAKNHDTEKRVGVLTTKESGVSNTLTGLEAEKTYYVKELSCPDWLQLDDEIHSVTIISDKTSKVYSTDKAEPGTVILYKSVDIGYVPDGQTIEGIQFGVYTSMEAANKNLESPDDRVAVLVTKADGLTDKVTLDPGQYYIKEIWCPSWMDMDDEVKSIELLPGEKEKIYSTNYMKKGKLYVRKLIDVSPVPESLSIAGIIYGVYDSYASAEANEESGLLHTLVTDEWGVTNSVAIMPGTTYYVREITCPSWLELDLQIYPVEASYGQNESICVESTDWVKHGPIKVIKTTNLDSLPEGYHLEGIQYGIYSSESDAKNLSNQVGSLITNENGISNEVSLFPGTYYVKEVSCPDWMELDNSIYTVTLNFGQTEPSVIHAKNYVKKGNVKVKKVTTVSIPEDFSLSGAKYGIFRSEEDAMEHENLVETMITNADGNTNSVELDYGTYYIKEYECPDWLEMDEKIYEVTILPSKTEVIQSTDVPKTGYINLVKTKGGPSEFSIAGAQYGVYESIEDAKKHTNKIETLTVKDDGTSNKVKVAAGRKYYIREYRAAKHYELDESIHEVYVPFGNGQTVTVRSVDMPKQGFVTLKKESKIVAPHSKEDYSLAGAQYGVYGSEEDAKANIDSSGTLITDEKGISNTLELPPGTYFVKEYFAPEYMELDAKIYEVTLSSEETEIIRSVDQISTGYAQVLKVPAKDAALIAQCPELYSLEGAEYTIYASDSLSDDSIVGTLITDYKGYTNKILLAVGTYYIQETKRVHGFGWDKTVHTVTVEQNQTALVTSKEMPLVGPISILIKKMDKGGNGERPSLSGATFEVKYYKRLTKDTTGLEPERTWVFETKEQECNGEIYGIIGLSDEFRIGGDALYKNEEGVTVGLIGTYVIKEKNAPAGYVINDDDFVVQVTEESMIDLKSGDTISSPSFEIPTVEEYRKEFRLSLEKQDCEMETMPQGDATLSGAVFGLYKNGELLGEYSTGDDFKFITEYHTIGGDEDIFTVKEISPPTGYLPNGTEYKLSELVEKDILVQYTTVNKVVRNQVIKNKIAITKTMNAKSETGALTPEPGIQFQIYLKSAGSYEKAKDWEKETITTNRSGFAQSKDLPYGVYTVHQVNTTEGYNKVKDFDVFICEDGHKTEAYGFTLNNDQLDCEVKVTKVDRETGERIPVSGAKFKIKKAGTKDEWVQFTLKYPNTHVIDEFETDKSGTFQLPERLPYGSYELVELIAPEGYVLSEEPTNFVVDGTSDLLEVVKENDPQKGVIEIQKTGEFLTHVTSNDDGSYSPVFGEGYMEDVTFGIFAKSDIVTPDGTKRYTSGQEVDSITTGKSGVAISKPLYLGEYEVKEINTPDNHVQNTESYYVTLSYDAKKVQVTYKLEVKNNRQMATVKLLKEMEMDESFGYGSDTYEAVRFGLFANEEITAKDGTFIPKDGLIESIGIRPAETAYTGIFACDLPHGNFYVKEIETAEGYILGNDKYPIDFIYRDSKIPTVEIEVYGGKKIQNEIIRGDIYGLKTGENSEPLSSAVIGLFKSDETVFSEENALSVDVSDENGYFRFLDIAYGNYLVREIKAPAGYALKEVSYPIEISKEGQVVNLDIVNEVTKVEFTKSDITTGESVVGAELSIYPCNESGEVLDKPIEKWITSEEPHLVKQLPPGEYILREVLGEAAAYGYVTAEEVHFTVEDSGEIQKVEMKDDYTKVEFSKLDQENGMPLSGAVLQILNEEGNLVVEFESKTDSYKMEYLPIGEYILHEKTPPLGYGVAADLKFTVQDTGEIQRYVMEDLKLPEEREPQSPDTSEDAKDEDVTEVVPEKEPNPVETSKETKEDMPDTGDKQHLLTWILVAIITSTITVFSYKQKKQSK